MDVRWRRIAWVLIVAAGCGAEEPEPEPGLSAAQRRSLLSLFALQARDMGDQAGDGSAAAAPYRASTTVNCTPQELTPPTDCPDGGNIYYTIDLGCTGPSLCCGQEPPCTEDLFSIAGLGTVLYNNCTVIDDQGGRIVVNGSLHVGIDSDTRFTCSGVYDSETVVRVNGMPTVQHNGREVCPGLVTLEARATLGYEVVTTVKGTVCGVEVSELYAEGCMVTCGDGACCPGGTTCSTCVSGCVPEGHVDCCNGKHCPPGTQCTPDGQACML